jgi:hypothetical protein
MGIVMLKVINLLLVRISIERSSVELEQVSHLSPGNVHYMMVYARCHVLVAMKQYAKEVLCLHIAFGWRRMEQLIQENV